MNLHCLTKWATGLLLIGVAAGGTGMSMLARSAPRDAEQRTEAVADDNRYRITMAGGATFEVVAVSNHYGSPKTWWGPDGIPLNEAPVDPSQKEHPANYSSGSRREVLSMLDAEFAIPPDQIREFRVQSRPFDRAEIKDIALKPRPAGKSTSKAESPAPRL